MKQMALALCVMLGLAPSPVCAAPGDDDLERCHNLGTTMDISACLDGFTQDWDRKLNAAYQKAMAAADAEAGQRPQLQAAERAWLTFRKQNCAYYATTSGTISRVVGADCLARMTRDRALELEEGVRP